MFPIADSQPRRRVPISVMLIVALNVLVFWHMLHLPLRLADAFTDHYALIPARDFFRPIRWTPFFTSMFLHGGFLHLATNLWSFWIFGDNIEDELGSVKFLFFYLTCGVAAALTHAFLEPTSQLPVVGASGAIAGIMGAYLVLFPRARIRMFTLLIFYPLFFEIPAVVFLLIWFLGQLMSGAQVWSDVHSGVSETGGIAFFAHVGGFVSGIVLLPLFRQGRGR